MSYLMHYGKGHLDGGHSGRYPYGSGERPYQSSEKLVSKYSNIKCSDFKNSAIIAGTGVVVAASSFALSNLLGTPTLIPIGAILGFGPLAINSIKQTKQRNAHYLKDYIPPANSNMGSVRKFMAKYAYLNTRYEIDHAVAGENLVKALINADKKR